MGKNKKMSSQYLFKEAVKIVRKTGKRLIEEQVLEIKEKGKTDFVTDMDIFVQNRICNKLMKLTPEYVVFAEEKANDDVNFSGNLWILDPIDGTTNYIHHFCHSGISLAMVEEGKVIGGIVYLPFSDEMFVGLCGRCTYFTGGRRMCEWF